MLDEQKKVNLQLKNIKAFLNAISTLYGGSTPKYIYLPFLFTNALCPMHRWLRYQYDCRGVHENIGLSYYQDRKFGLVFTSY